LYKAAIDHLIQIFKGKHGEDFRMEGLSYLSLEWPRSHGWLNFNCQRALLEFYYVANERNNSAHSFVPPELVVLIIRQIVVIWPGFHMEIFKEE